MFKKLLLAVTVSLGLVIYISNDISTHQYDASVNGINYVDVTDAKLLMAYQRVIDNSYMTTPIKPTLERLDSTVGEAFTIPNKPQIFLYSGTVSDNIGDLDLSDKEDDDVLWLLCVLAHEYGHQLQYMRGQFLNREVYDIEVEASTYASYAMLRMGYTKERLKQFYQSISDENSEQVPGNGHDNVKQEYLDNKNNVDHVNELLR